MAERAVVAAVILLIVMSLCLFMTESFIPIGKNLDFRDVCRGYLMKMEYCSGLSQSECADLENRLSEMGFSDITVLAPASAKAGTVMHLLVTAAISRDGFSGIFKRATRTYEMSYSRKAVARKVVNR